MLKTDTQSPDRQIRQSPGRHRFRLMQQTRGQKTEGHEVDWTHFWFNDSKKMLNDSFISFLNATQLIVSDSEFIIIAFKLTILGPVVPTKDKGTQ